jgi:hypothetical protein
MEEKDTVWVRIELPKPIHAELKKASKMSGVIMNRIASDGIAFRAKDIIRMCEEEHE